MMQRPIFEKLEVCLSKLKLEKKGQKKKNETKMSL